MKTVRVSLITIAVACCALLLSPGITRADGLTGTTDISYQFGSTTLYTDTLAVGSSLSCPGSSPICTAYAGDGIETLSLSPDSITFTVSGYPASTYSGAFNGLVFSDLTFSGLPFTGFTIAPGSTEDPAVTLGPTTIDINMAGLPVDGTFTVDFTSPVATPEPSSLLLLGVGLLALVGFTRRRGLALVAGRF
jgi:PEP-CTERM motif